MTALHELTIKAIRRAQSQGGIVDPVEDYAAIANLDKLARASTELPIHDKIIFCDLPVCVGDVRLYRLSWAAMDWISYCASEWFCDDSVLYDKALAWAHAHARQPDVFRDCSDKQSATKAIKRWTWSFSAPWICVLDAVDQLLAELPNKNTGKTESKSTTASFLDVLIETHGGTIDYWMWDVSVSAMLALTEAIQHRNDENECAQITGSGKAPDPNSFMVKKTMEFQRKAREFVQGIVSRSANRDENGPAQHGGMKEAKKVDSNTGFASVSAIGKNSSEKPNQT